MTARRLFQCGIGFCNGNNQLNNKRDVQLAASAFQSMSPEEQDEVFSDLYGYEDGSWIKETPRFVKEKLEGLVRELDKLSAPIMKYYLRAIQNEQEHNNDGGEPYVTSDQFLLMFLRADRFDCRLAARRLTVYFKEKYDMFGDESLARRIKQSDFSKEDKKTLLAGAFCFTGETDMAGRPILFCRRQYVFEQDIMSMKRVAFYLFQNALEENELAQKRGVLYIGYNVNDEHVKSSPNKLRAILPIARMVINALPVRFSCCHICYDDIRNRMFTNLFLVVLPKYVRARFQCHFSNTPAECLLNLMPYGIDPDTLPITPDGEFRYEKVCASMKQKQESEERKSKTDGDFWHEHVCVSMKRKQESEERRLYSEIQ